MFARKMMFPGLQRCRGNLPVAPTSIFQTSDFSKTSDVFLQGEHCLFQANFTGRGVSQTSDVCQTSDV
jgi:hypothetical protein